ncbi:MAG: branched-chain amino acid ABC transporter permease [Pirellulales bacterium]|nr:branched-chain amino acid ABC transporter permease [Pirellulales bacterium]
MLPLLAVADTAPDWFTFFLQQCINGLTYGALIALIALGYTMVYGIIGLINFAHGDLFMLGTFLALTLISAFGLDTPDASSGAIAVGLLAIFPIAAVFCGALNLAVDRIVYKPLRRAPKLAPLVSAIGVSFIFQNIGLLWKGPADLSVPSLVPRTDFFSDPTLEFTVKDLFLTLTVLPIMFGLTLLVKYTRLGKSMRAVSQNPTAAQLMGIHVERVIGNTFAMGGALAGFASVIYALYINTVGFQIGYINGLYAFTAAVLGGIGNIPGAVLGGLVIGLVRSLGAAYVGARWATAIIFGILIVILIFRPSGLLGERTREKV